MESPQRDQRPPTLPTTIQAGPDATHDEPAYHLPILRMYALLISPELRLLRHPTISRHHPSMLVLTLSRYARTGWPYLAVLVSIRPAHATQSRTVLHRRDTDRITSSMPYHDPQRKKAKR